MEVKLHEGFSDTTVIIQCPEITGEIQKLESLILGSSQKLSFTKNYKTHLVDRRDVLYIESVDK